MSLRDWWEAIKDLFEKPKDKADSEKRFLPPHTLPESELPPKWPHKKDRGQ